MVGTTQGNDIAGLLKLAGLRPTRQRIALGALLFGQGDRHLTAEMLHMEAITSAIPVSLATVYNTLHQFTEAGLLREVAVEGSKTYFDTNTSDHHHFYFERDGTLMDIEANTMSVMSLPEPPEGMAIGRVDVLIRLVSKGGRREEP
jgi:Fur family transcriptional regulator, iron response regulator